MAKTDTALEVRRHLENPATVAQMTKLIPAIAAKYLTPERVARIVFGAVSRSPQLLGCDPRSIVIACMDALQLGLEPAGPLKQAYLIPYGNKRTGTSDAQMMIGYMGLLTLAKRSGAIQACAAEVVYPGDEFSIELGSDMRVSHRPRLDGRSDYSQIKGAYAWARLDDGSVATEFMTKEQIERVRAASKAGASEIGPWTQWWDMMARKTVIRRLISRLPIVVTPELADAVGNDEDQEEVRIVDGGDLEALPQEPATRRLAAKSRAAAREQAPAQEKEPELDDEQKALLREYEEHATSDQTSR
jgi:recombination protein RecT